MRIVSVEEVIELAEKGKKYQFQARYGGMLHDVRSINKRKRTAKLMDEYGGFIKPLEDLDEILLDEDMYG